MALHEYEIKHNVELPKVLADRRFKYEKEYQEYHNLHQDNWELIESHMYLCNKEEEGE